VLDRRPDAAADLPPEFWQIQKLVKYLKVQRGDAIWRMILKQRS